ncbi:PREDICTED: phospholipase A2 inhibitor subunit gamma B-like [Cyprinodon variegatus]|uniref:phospholipase A2 inhibitor subunit gamma B-like n=1 Tax=Cyprinodon variegatus TaxID=28743 RepID=UPI000742B42C|nr:PREDICTED: phospholipase A2 inhibitor subunit gamma B-like [Cyprinodon variegatus]
MKLIFLLNLLWVLCSTARALQCVTCTDKTCASTVPLTCGSETMCITARILGTQSGATATQIYKACASSSLCPATGSSSFSVNMGLQSAVADAVCCNTDNCNSQTLSIPPTRTPNSLQCIVCDPTTFQCNTPITCKGEENNCFTAFVTDGTKRFPAMGCVSPNACAAASNLGGLPFMHNFRIVRGPECCTTSLCNVPTTAPQTTPTAQSTTTAEIAGGLQCLTCTDEACLSTVSVTCCSEIMCITAVMLATSSGATNQQIYKGCASSSLCPRTGSHTYSINLGFQSAIASAECCNTDNCNSQTLSCGSNHRIF